MAYTPPARDNIVLVIGSGYSPPARDSIELQFGDDPLTKPQLTVTCPGLSGPAGRLVVTVNGSQCGTDNPQADCIVYQRSEDGENWTDLGDLDFQDYEFTYDLKEGHLYYFRAATKTNLSPTPKLSPYSQDSAYTDYLLQITDCTDGQGNKLVGAVVIAVPEEELLSQVNKTTEGQDWPELSYKRCNKTDENGQCSIQIPGGKGKVWVMMIPAESDVDGDSITHIVAEEE